MSYTLMDQIADRRADEARRAAMLHTEEMNASQEHLMEYLQDEFIARETEAILKDIALVDALILAHWELHPSKVGRLIALAAAGDDMWSRAAFAELRALAERLADSEACRRWNEGKRA
jgi:hypothetical protein